MSLLLLMLMQKKGKEVFWYHCLLYPIRTESTQRAGSSCMVICVAITAPHPCGDIEWRKRVAKLRMDQKLATTATMLIAALLYQGSRFVYLLFYKTCKL